MAELIGYSKNYGFPGQLVLEGDKARAVIEGLRITTRTLLEQLGVEKPPARDPLLVQRAALERQHTPVVSFERPATTTSGNFSCCTGMASIAFTGCLPASSGEFRHPTTGGI
ncbi:hypothetical protein [Streptomyces hygroscopicus]|uniref:hypothetical protein n=1 Tax=Streptomyces hygroscopicus TaxID=1912 RepID=UPI00369ED187